MNKSIKTALNRLCGDPKCARERLLQTAGMLYAERGLDAVSTRELTGEAGVNLPPSPITSAARTACATR